MPRSTLPGRALARGLGAAGLLLAGVWAAPGWGPAAVGPARAASEPYVVPLTDGGTNGADQGTAGAEPGAAGQQEARPDEPPAQVPPPPALTQPEAEAAPTPPPAAATDLLTEPAETEPATRAPEPAPAVETAPPAAPAAATSTTPTPEQAAPATTAPANTKPAGESAPQAAARSQETEKMLRQLMADDSVVAIVDGKAILWGDVWREAEQLPADYRQQPEALFPALLQRAVDMILLANAARREGLDKDPEIRRNVANYEERLMREQLLQRQIAAQVTDDKLQALYREHIARQAGAVEVTARHIQLDSREDALAVIDALDHGADFAALARERSLAGSGKQGGDLGSFRLDRMPPGFAAAIAKLSPGQYSREPVKSEFGWHVILLERREGKRLPTFAELEPKLRQEAERRAIADLLQDLRKRARIEVMPVAAGEQKPE